MFAHAEAIRLHKEALSIVRGLPAGQRPGQARARGPGSHGRAAQRQVRLLLPGAPADARALDRPGGIAGPQGLDAHRPGRAIRDAVRPGTHRRRVPDGQPRAGPRRSRLRAERPGSLRRRRVGHQPRQAGGGGAPPRARRQPGRAAPSGSASAPGPTCTGRPGPRTPTGCLATTTRPWPAATTRSTWPGPSITPTAWPSPWPTAASPTRCATTCPGWPTRGRAARAVRPVQLRLLPRVGADPGRLVPRRTGGHRTGPAGHQQPQVGGRVRPYDVLAVAAR